MSFLENCTTNAFITTHQTNGKPPPRHNGYPRHSNEGIRFEFPHDNYWGMKCFPKTKIPNKYKRLKTETIRLIVLQRDISTYYIHNFTPISHTLIPPWQAGMKHQLLLWNTNMSNSTVTTYYIQWIFPTTFLHILGSIFSSLKTVQLISSNVKAE